MTTFEERLCADGPNALQSPELRRRELAADIIAASYLEGDFALASGDVTHFYLDKYRFVTQPTILRRLGNLLAPRVPEGVDRLVARRLGAASVIVALALESGIPFAILPDGPSKEGEFVQGEIHSRERVLLVEDVVSTGRAALAAATALRTASAEVVGILAVIDRHDGARSLLAQEGLVLDSLIRLDEFVGDGAL